MTSIQNNEQTINFFKEHNYFGYDKNKIQFFKQGTLPMLTPEGKMIIEDNKIKVASDGNGGVYSALEKEKMLEDMKSKKIKWVYISRCRQHNGKANRSFIYWTNNKEKYASCFKINCKGLS